MSIQHCKSVKSGSSIHKGRSANIRHLSDILANGEYYEYRLRPEYLRMVERHKAVTDSLKSKKKKIVKKSKSRKSKLFSAWIDLADKSIDDIINHG